MHEYQRIASLCATLSRPALRQCVGVEELPHSAGERPTLAEYLGALLAHLEAHLRQIEESHGRDGRTSRTGESQDLRGQRLSVGKGSADRWSRNRLEPCRRVSGSCSASRTSPDVSSSGEFAYEPCGVRTQDCLTKHPLL